MVSSLFLLWGFCNGLIDVMDKLFQDELRLSKALSAWVQFAHYLGYFLMAFPAGWMARKFGYKGGIIVGLVIVAVGSFWFIPATHIQAMAQNGQTSLTMAFVAFLLGVCTIATGLTFLETVANPYTTVLGPREFAAARINLAQSCNGIGWIFGPIVGSMYFYSKDAAGQSTGSQTLYIPYMGIAIVVLVLAVGFYLAHIPEVVVEDDHDANEVMVGREHSIWSHPHFVGAVAAQFLYVAAQAGIFSFFINYMTAEVPAIPASWQLAMARVSGSLPVGHSWLTGWFEARHGILNISDKGAANLASLGFICFLLGRFTGAGLMKKYPAHRILGIYALVNIGLTALTFLKLGWLSVVALFLTFFFMSVMFPTIFSLGIDGLGEKAKKASSFIVMAIMGGAVVPKIMGYVGDRYNMSAAFAVPLLCFVGVAIYGLS